MASTQFSTQYAGQQTVASSRYASYPQPPPSPPMDETSKCSLPSISNLLGLADQGSPTSESFPQNQQQQQAAVPQTKGDSSKPSTRPSSSHYGGARGNLPPTPPMSNDASFDGYNSPSTRSVSQMSVGSQPQPQPQHQQPFYCENTPPLEADPSRPVSQMSAAPRLPMQSATPAPYPQPMPFNPSAAASSYLPPQASHLAQTAAFYPPMHATPPPQAQQMPGFYYQRGLPQTFPPPPPTMLGGPNPWQHHHYISPSAAAAFPQPQDRYVCPTCSKAFSRPSSLRIHSHSHTGEKPFKCPHSGCGKAFSVRSNMKRHERGCHNLQ